MKLEKFFTKVRKKDDLDYEPDSLQVILRVTCRQVTVFLVLRTENLLTASKYIKGKLPSIMRAATNVPMHHWP